MFFTKKNNKPFTKKNIFCFAMRTLQPLEYGGNSYLRNRADGTWGQEGQGGHWTPPPNFWPFCINFYIKWHSVTTGPSNYFELPTCLRKMIVLKMCASICVQIQFEFVKMKTTFLSIVFLLTIQGVYCVQAIFCQSESFFH